MSTQRQELTQTRTARRDAGYAAIRLVGYGLIWMGMVLLSIAGVAGTIEHIF